MNLVLGVFQLVVQLRSGGGASRWLSLAMGVFFIIAAGYLCSALALRYRQRSAPGSESGAEQISRS
jgi:uncharacterized membrane protein HdeD (DUF308 family)